MYQNINVDYLKYCSRIFLLLHRFKCLKVQCSNIYLCCQYCQNCQVYYSGFVIHFGVAHLHKIPPPVCFSPPPNSHMPFPISRGKGKKTCQFNQRIQVSFAVAEAEIPHNAVKPPPPYPALLSWVPAPRLHRKGSRVALAFPNGINNTATQPAARCLETGPLEAERLSLPSDTRSIRRAAKSQKCLA